LTRDRPILTSRSRTLRRLASPGVKRETVDVGTVLKKSRLAETLGWQIRLKLRRVGLGPALFFSHGARV
jgi:hypothetical protein